MPPKKDGTNEDGDVKGVGLEDSNMANYGSKEHIDARKNAAKSEKEFVGAGQKVGLEIWRVENRRTAADTPDFGVKRWPKEDYGSFYSGDSYLVLNTYRPKDPLTGKDMDKLAWDVHFWLGKESSQDEIGVAAYKAVELDDLLDDGPVQHREVQYEESKLFQSYFPAGVRYMEGGIASGFRAVKPTEYVPRLFQIKRTAKTIRAWQVPVAAKSMNQGDVFILDAGLKIYTFIGTDANAFEKLKGAQMVQSLISGRMGKSKVENDLDDEFWKILKGKMSDVLPAVPDAEVENPKDAPLDANKVILYRLSDASGKLEFKKEKEGKITIKDFDHNDVFVVDADIEIFVWVGKGASPSEKSQCMKFATDYLKFAKKPEATPITRIKDGQIHHVFGSLLAENQGARTGGGGGASASAATSGGPKLGDLINADKSGQNITQKPVEEKKPAFATVGLKSTPGGKKG